MEWADLVPVAVGALGGAGGFAALLRARTQNRVDERAQLTAEQQQFRQAMAAELAALRATIATLQTDKERVESKLDDQREKLVELQTLDKVKTRQIEQLEQRNRDLEQLVAGQAQQLEQVRTQRETVERELLKVSSARDFLERENTALRRENELLRADRLQSSSNPA